MHIAEYLKQTPKFRIKLQRKSKKQQKGREHALAGCHSKRHETMEIAFQISTDGKNAPARMDILGS